MTTAANQIERFCKLWADNLVVLLASCGVSSPVATLGKTISTPAPSQQEFEKLVCIRFTCGGAVKGEFLWVAEKSAALQVARLLLPAEPGAAAEFSDQDRDAFAEFLRQVAGQTATSWKAEAGSEIEFNHQATAEPKPGTAHCVTFTLTGEGFAELPLRLFMDGELSEALSTQLAEPATPADSPAPTPQPTPPVQPPAQQTPVPKNTEPAPAYVYSPPPPVRTEPLPTNLGLVLDVALEATIRFGEREMLLRDIFGLMAGAVVELSQMVNETAELHVAGRLVARGEVVVVDGNFGLRVTEVSSINERMAAIQL